MEEPLIVGAGPVGLTMACELLRHGVPVRLIDKNQQPSDKSKALVIWPRTLEQLDSAGIVERFLDAGFPLHGMSVFETPEKRLTQVSFENVASPFPFVLSLPQCETERILLERAVELGVKVERGVELVGLSHTDTAACAQLKHPDGRLEDVSTPWLLACDGGRSSARHLLGIKLEGQTVPQEFAMADCEVQGLSHFDEVTVFAGQHGICACFPIRRPNRFRIFVVRHQLGEGPEPQPPTLDEIQEELVKRGLGHLRLSNPHWLSAFRINERHALNYRHGRVFLAGDAAHVHSPVGGQGMNTGMQDAFNLAWKLAYTLKHRVAPLPWLDSYTEEREPVGAQVVATTGRARDAMTLRHPVATQIRNKIMSFVTSFEFVRHKITEQVAELAVRYPKSLLNQEVHEGHAAWLLGQGVHPGDRAPDGWLQSDLNENGEGRTLFSLMRDTHFHLLWFSGLDQAAGLELRDCYQWLQEQTIDWIQLHWIADNVEHLEHYRSRWLDSEARLHRVYGASLPTIYLIRPDGYVAFRSQPATLASLQKYLYDLGFLRK